MKTLYSREHFETYSILCSLIKARSVSALLTNTTKIDIANTLLECLNFDHPFIFFHSVSLCFSFLVCCSLCNANLHNANYEERIDKSVRAPLILVILLVLLFTFRLICLLLFFFFRSSYVLQNLVFIKRILVWKLLYRLLIHGIVSSE